MGVGVFSYIRRLGQYLGVPNLNFNILGVFRKLNIFGGMKKVWMFWDSLQNWTILNHYLIQYSSLPLMCVTFSAFWQRHCNLPGITRMAVKLSSQ